MGILKALAKIVLGAISRLLLSVPCLFLHFRGYKLVKIKSDRIGHLVAETHSIVRDPLLYGKKIIFFVKRGKIANPAYLNLFKSKYEHSFVEVHPLLFKIIFFPKFVSVNVDQYCTLDDAANRVYQIGATIPCGFGKWDLPADAQSELQRFLCNSGIPNTKKLVLIHLRTSAFAPEEEDEHGGRTVTPEEYRKGIEYLCEAGYSVVRMGDPNNYISIDHAQYVDYASSFFRSDSLDLALAANCHFMIACSSGPVNLAALFNRPVLGVNLSLPFVFSPTGRSCEIGVPKLMVRGGTGRILPLSEIYANDYHMIRTSAQLRANDLRLLNNSEDELLEAIQEMIAALENGFNDNAGYLDVSMLIKQHNNSVAIDSGSLSRPSITFFSRHKHSLIDVPRTD
jgi:putative glycosyltransferase (TIGR04372 family)